MALEHEFLVIPLELAAVLFELQGMYNPWNGSIRYGNADIDNIPWPEGKLFDLAQERISYLMCYYKANRCTAISIQDNLILPNLNIFGAIETLMYGFIPFVGLNYYGFTIIPHHSVLEFSALLKNISRNTEFSELISLCEKACKGKSCILHCGV